MSKIYLSIIIPCLNEEHFIPKLLKNLNSQTFKNFETIVVDCNSEDQTQKVVTNFPAKYSLRLYTTATRNVSFQRNLGAKKAKGQILIFFDADTQIPKNYLQKIAETFQKKQPDFLTTFMDVDSNNISVKIFGWFNNLTFIAGKISKSPSSYGAMQAVKKDSFFKVGGYDSKVKFGEDSHLFIKLIKSGHKYMVLCSPRYIFSTRRLHSEGFIKLVIKYIRLKTKIALKGHYAEHKVTYAMGGKHYHRPSK